MAVIFWPSSSSLTIRLHGGRKWPVQTASLAKDIRIRACPRTTIDISHGWGVRRPPRRARSSQEP
eukprot:14567704-Alexandrium_andersonii.AAC.1